jgi:hypothetical protein
MMFWICFWVTHLEDLQVKVNEFRPDLMGVNLFSDKYN